MTRSLVYLMLAACGTAASRPPSAGGPRGLRADDHLAAAREHDDAARREGMWPDTRPGGPMDVAAIPWFRAWDPDGHERLADIHRSQAAELQAEFDSACAGIEEAEISISPLQRFGIGSWNTTTGVILYLSPTAGSPDRLLRLLRCHRAWMMLGPTDMEACPLDLPSIAIDARGDADGITLSIIARDPKVVPELQRRAAMDLESAAARRRPK
jgi:hypothetical protein